ncbi:MAG TPA: ABC transporter C-terminal domain-containing protein, partial [Microbacteriaceae bacterium]|nr:ABC transporter C-terminal domain-containing protein [Microbacteriaceae bacterium]
PAKSTLSGAELRNSQKEIAAIDRKLVKLADQIAQAHECLAVHDQSDYDGLGTLTAELRRLEAQVVELETRWLELSELLGG